MRTDREVRSRSASKVAGWSSSGESRKIAVDKNAAQGWFHVIFCHRPRPTARINRGNRPAIPLEGPPSSIDAERKIDEGGGEKEKGKGGEKRKRREAPDLGRWPSEGRPQAGRETRLIYVRKWPINRRDRRTSPVSKSRKRSLTLNARFAAVHLGPRRKRLRRRRRRRANVGRRGWNSRVVPRVVQPSSNRNMPGPSKFLLRRGGGEDPFRTGYRNCIHRVVWKDEMRFSEPCSIPRPPFRSRNHRAE